ncbi:hypothetical protein E2542_SST09379 [Spatholobus suberectus]|nr:hypothetical protein E2542_SST09379 [Spatholobus suberectus]
MVILRLSFGRIIGERALLQMFEFEAHINKEQGTVAWVVVDGRSVSLWLRHGLSNRVAEVMNVGLFHMAQRLLVSSLLLEVDQVMEAYV